MYSPVAAVTLLLAACPSSMAAPAPSTPVESGELTVPHPFWQMWEGWNLFLNHQGEPVRPMCKSYGDRDCCFKDDSNCPEDRKCCGWNTCDATCEFGGGVAFWSCKFVPDFPCTAMSHVESAALAYRMSQDAHEREAPQGKRPATGKQQVMNEI